MSIWYGNHVAAESDLRLCGDLTGKRVLELGIIGPSNAVYIAQCGAKALVHDPHAHTIAAVRAAADRAEVKVECHQGELADLGWATSATIDLVIASHSLTTVDDVPRVLRQVHRVLRIGAPFVVAIGHPVVAMFGGETTARMAQYRYGANTLPFSDLYMMFERSNFHIEMVHELTDRRHRDWVTPSVLALRARKLGN